MDDKTSTLFSLSLPLDHEVSVEYRMIKDLSICDYPPCLFFFPEKIEQGCFQLERQHRDQPFITGKKWIVLHCSRRDATVVCMCPIKYSKAKGLGCFLSFLVPKQLAGPLLHAEVSWSL